jgi:hypothetical protein
MQLIRNTVKLELVFMHEIIELDIWILCNLEKISIFFSIVNCGGNQIPTYQPEYRVYLTL